MRINTNVSSLTAQEAAQNTGKRITSSLEKLSTGLRINKASDDASGLAIADKLRTQATSINQGIANGNSAVSLLQIADKSMGEQSNILDTIKSKLIQANTDTTSADGREAIRKDISKLLEQLDNIAEQTNYNGNVLLQKGARDTGSSNALSFQIGETSRDIITNATIQSNTTGLGSSVTYSAANDNNTMAAGSTMSLASAGSISLASTNVSGSNTAETVSLSGDLDTVTLKAGTTISGMDSASQAAFITQMGAAGTNYTQSGSSFTMINDETLDLSTITTNKTASVTTLGESSSSYTAQVGDIVKNTDVNDGSALATALLASTKFQDNLDGTYTVKAAGAGSYTLEAGESINYDRATEDKTFSTGDKITASTTEPGSVLATALTDTNKFTNNGDGTYTATALAGTVKIGAGESVTVDTPKTTGTISVGDYINATTVTANSALDKALKDTTKFDDINGDGSVYKAIANVSAVTLAAGESIGKVESVEITSPGDFVAGTKLTVTTADVIAGGDLENQLNNTSKFSEVDNGDGTKTYTVLESYTTPSISLGEGESVTIQPAVNVSLASTIGALTGSAVIDEANVKVGQPGSLVAADIDTVDKDVIAQGAADGTTPLTAAGTDVLEFKVTLSGAGASTFAYLAGDKISSITDGGTTDITQDLITSGKFVDNGDGSYTATAVGSIDMNDATDAFTVTRPVGLAASAASTESGPAVATTIARTTETIAGTSGTTPVAPSEKVSVTFTTNSKVDVTNNGSSTNTLTITGDEEITNGGTQLTSLGALGAGELTQAKAAEFQTVIDDAITDLNSYRGDIGSTQNQVESAVRNLMTQATNVKAAESIIRDVDYAAESANFNKQNIISQAGSYAISQSNAVQQNVLRLLQ